ncbi:MBL fold metallo-hydrolase [Pedobacter xixiisoli]|uniref:Phosphoribosyl 1,2-cyclic phosphodiesterase n=1 Tax=Pedobacter xixiisoli TaxID=1476464 RepID=A0A285ZUE7_9SPHI|nr:MBL fold metallo-hydrolase [Pedobacter xixiisoli]SOD13256.1 Phosphoribosyl 1,2-cyclic phosphodiesterase [Pedobacter xixiisoli]
MSLYITSLNTGSNGNCFYIGNDEDAVLIDAGLSCKETEARLTRLGLTMHKVRAIFISHEHSDHIKGLPVLAKKYQLPIYITAKTHLGGRQILPAHLVYAFSSTLPIQIGSLQVTAFTKLHDAAEPHSFTISFNNINVGVFTDIGDHCENLIYHFKQCHAVFLEANYDDEMLDKGNYPYFLKRRIRGGNGHLSNRKALDLFTNHRPDFMSHLFLSHLSRENNCPDLVQRLFNEVANGVEIIVASRLQETPVYRIGVNEIKTVLAE